MQYSPHLPAAYISLDAITANYRILERISTAALAAVGGAPPPAPLPGADGQIQPFAWPSQMAVVKADAYGHGHIQVAQALLRRGARCMASGSVQEAAALRQGIAAERQQPAILSLLGLVGPDDVALCAAYGIIPVIHSLDQLPLLEAAEKPLAVALKCNTGMCRLGFNEDEVPLLPEALRDFSRVRPVLALSHLAAADTDAGREEIARQGRVFARMLTALRATWPDMAASLGNSAGTLLASDISSSIGPHICRPGVALYGSNPFAGTTLSNLGKGLTPAMSVCAPVIAVRELKAGDGLGYGHTFVAKESTPIAIVAAGYADAFSRGLSNSSAMCVKGVRAPVLGRVSMQMTAIGLAGLQPGQRNNRPPRPDLAWLLGGPYANAVSAEELAAQWGTITYEVFCMLGHNNRVYSGL